MPSAGPASPVLVPEKIALVMRRQQGIGRRLHAYGVVLPLTLLAMSLGIILLSGLVSAGAGLVLALVPLPLVMLILLRLDRFEPEPTRLIVRTFLWGAGGATLIAIVINSTVDLAAGEAVATVFSAPIVEESAKALALLFVIRKRPGVLDGVHDGIVYAAWVALGFATVENILYYADAFNQEGAGGVTTVFILRGVMTPLCHPLFTAMTGIALGIAVTRRRGRFVRFVIVSVGLLLAMLLHGLWNLSAETGATIIVYLVGYLPLATIGMALLIGGARRQRRTLREGLQPEVAVGTISEHEYALLIAGGRARARLRRRTRRAGREPARLLYAYESAAYELASLNVRGLRTRVRAEDPVAVLSMYRDCLVSARGGLQSLAPQVIPD